MIKMCIEVQAGSSLRYHFNRDSLERQGVRRVSQPYPYPYGFILGTRTEDGEALDCYLITKRRLKPGEVVECQPIGLLEMNESGEVDHKVLAAMEQEEVAISPGLREELSEFIYAVFAKYPGVNVQVGEIRPLQDALDHIQASRAAIT